MFIVEITLTIFSGEIITNMYKRAFAGFDNAFIIK